MVLDKVLFQGWISLPYKIKVDEEGNPYIAIPDVKEIKIV